MKRLAVAAFVMLVACGGEPPEPNPREAWVPIEGGDLLYREVEIPDGQTIPCIYDASAMSCDWSER